MEEQRRFAVSLRFPSIVHQSKFKIGSRAGHPFPELLGFLRDQEAAVWRDGGLLIYRQGPFPTGRDLFPKGPAREMRMRSRKGFFHSPLPRRTRRNAVAACSGATRSRSALRMALRQTRPCRGRLVGRDLFQKGPANGSRMPGRSGTSFSSHSPDASEKRPCPGEPNPSLAIHHQPTPCSGRQLCGQRSK